jgi:hypothetical protein
MTSQRTGAGGAPLPNGRALVVGGGGLTAPSASAEIFDAASGKFASSGGTNVTGPSTAAAPLPDGRVLVAGGVPPSGLSGLIFDPVTATFASTNYMTTGRYGAAAAALPDGRVLVAGTALVSFGPNARGATRSAELFTPVLSYRLNGRRLSVDVAVAGTLTASDANSHPGASAAARKARPSLKPALKKGAPPRRISLMLTPTGKTKRTLGRTGKVRVLVRLGFMPKRVKGDCVTEVSPCFSSDYGISQTVKLTLKGKRRR